MLEAARFPVLLCPADSGHYSLLRPGACNALGVQLGNGWAAQSTVSVYPIQLRALLSVTLADGERLLFPSLLAPPPPTAAVAGALVFNDLAPVVGHLNPRIGVHFTASNFALTS
jgi:hypothetical protein